MRDPANVQKIQQFMRELGGAVKSPGRVYFTGGVTAVLLGWRDTTLDLDLKADPEPNGFFEALPKLKNRIDVNVELAAPDDFVPALPGWRERSARIGAEGKLEFYHYDFYGQALSKIERFYDRDQIDVKRMVKDGLVDSKKLWEMFVTVEDKLIRFPAIHAETLRARIKKLAEEGTL